jgi:hypothetical protein
VTRLLKYLWAGPVTALGLLLGLLAASSGGRLRFRAGVAEVSGGLVGRLLRGNRLWQGGAAMALGHDILARDPVTLERSRQHELAHVRQFERWGVFLLPAYVLVSWWLVWGGYDSHLDNPFEQEPYGQKGNA